MANASSAPPTWPPPSSGGSPRSARAGRRSSTCSASGIPEAEAMPAPASTPVVIHDTTVVTGDAAGTIHYRAALAVEGRRIAAIGPSAEILARHPGAERVDGRGRAVLPGFANTHTHLARTLARGI